ncbi:VirD4-like conjugal transfer protein, CD1115 family [Enterococcus rotai]|uniref:VirD4-like conjugal transfer protein, CD1115 family n=1 Tax=Enterococcus rotai TaxID=118060 RepID=UPI003393E4C9
MQTYKKELKPYLILACILFLLGFSVGNFFYLLPGYDYSSKLNYLFTRELLPYVESSFFSFFITPSFLGFGTGFLGFFSGLLMYVYDNDRGIYRNGEEYGSARYATNEEMKKYEDEIPQNNKILSKNVKVSLFNSRLPIKLQKNKSDLVIGDSGAAKTLSYIKTNIMQRNCSFLLTDPDGGVVHEVGHLLEEDHYNIKILDLNTLTNSDKFNVFKYMKTELDVDRVLEAVTEATKKGDQQDIDFWPKAEGLLIRSFIAYLWFDGQDNDYLPHLGMIADMLRFVKRKDPKVPSPVEEWFEEQNERHPNNYAYKQWSLFNDLFEAETRASVLGIAAARYSVFDHEQVVDLIRDDTMDIDSWTEEKTAVFIAIPETNDAYNFISALFMATVAEQLRVKSDAVRLGKRFLRKGKKLLHFRFLMDEFANIGRIPHFEKLLTTFRKREMSFAIILQSLNQLQAMYKNSWENIVNGCASLIFLGGDEEKTAKYLSNRIGKQTLSIRKHNISKGRGSGGSENRDKLGRALLDESEVTKIDGDECLVFITKEHVFRDKKFYAFDHELAYLLGNEPGDENWYTYKRYRNEEEELLDKVRKENIVDHGTIMDDAA